MLVFAEQQSESALCIHPLCLEPPATPPSHPSKSPRSTKLSSLCPTAGSHQLSILHMVLYTCCHPNSCYPPFQPCVHKSILSVCVSILALQIGSSVPFSRFYIYMCVCVLIYDVCFCLSDLFHLLSFLEREWRWYWWDGPHTTLTVHCFLFLFWLCHMACGILVTWPGTEPGPQG